MTAYRRFQSAVGEPARNVPRILRCRYADSSTVVPGCYDRELNPGARAWFRESATELLALAAGYLRLLDRYDVP